MNDFLSDAMIMVLPRAEFEISVYFSNNKINFFTNKKFIELVNLALFSVHELNYIVFCNIAVFVSCYLTVLICLIFLTPTLILVLAKFDHIMVSYFENYLILYKRGIFREVSQISNPIPIYYAVLFLDVNMCPLDHLRVFHHRELRQDQ